MRYKKFIGQFAKNRAVLDIDLKDDSWRRAVPSDPGWYFIETDTPPDIFLKLGKPKGKNHYNLPQKANVSLSLRGLGICILPNSDPNYFVYSGEAKNLKARAREHIAGYSKTYCLALTNYPILHKYVWKFHYISCQFGKEPNDSKLLRIYGEQLWRAKHGWPILCGK